MKYRVFISLGNNIAKDPTLISYYIDYDSKRSRFTKKGKFDGEQWEEAHTHIMMKKGANPKDAWKSAWQFVRLMTRELQRFPFKKNDCVTGYTFEPVFNDNPRRLP